jgi:hypothetical protein
MLISLPLWHTRCVRSRLPMNKVTLWLVAIFLVGAVEVVDAQQAKTIRRIGFLVNTGTPYQDAFYRRLREVGICRGTEPDR